MILSVVWCRWFIWKYTFFKLVAWGETHTTHMGPVITGFTRQGRTYTACKHLWLAHAGKNHLLPIALCRLCHSGIIGAVTIYVDFNVYICVYAYDSLLLFQMKHFFVFSILPLIVVCVVDKSEPTNPTIWYHEMHLSINLKQYRAKISCH